MYDSVKSLGVTIDETLSVYTQVNNVCKASYFHIRALCHISEYKSLRRLHERWPAQLSVPDSTTAIQYCTAPLSRTSTKSNVSSTRWLEWSRALENVIALHRFWRNYTGSQSSRASRSVALIRNTSLRKTELLPFQTAPRTLRSSSSNRWCS